MRDRSNADEHREVQQANRVLWHQGNFRYLPAIVRDNFLTFIREEVTQPISGGYGQLSSERRDRFNEFLDALFTAIDASLADRTTGNWCDVRSKASDAGYEIYRFYDRATGRWFIFARDRTLFGQAYFFINPFAKRNIVIEVPHEPSDEFTKRQGARIFLELRARALIINKARRCADPRSADCAGETEVCDGYYRKSDVAHNTRNTFHLLHKRYADIDPVTKFAQFHGFGFSGSLAEIGDGTRNDHDLKSVSVRFANHLRGYVAFLRRGDVHSCQGAGDPPLGFCGELNVQGRYTNGRPDIDECAASTDRHSARFLHVEQARTLRDDIEGRDGAYWGDVRDALRDTWPDCNMNNGPIDCTLGPRQQLPPPLTCP